MVHFIERLAQPLLKVKLGEFPVIEKFLGQFLDDPDSRDELNSFLARMTQGRRNLISSTRRPLPVLVTVGSELLKVDDNVSAKHHVARTRFCRASPVPNSQLRQRQAFKCNRLALHFEIVISGAG